MNTLKRFLDLILFGNIYVAAGAFCLIQSTRIQLGLNDDLLFYSLLIFFATLFVYNLQRIFYKVQKDNSLHSIRRQWIFQNQFTVKLICALGLLGVVITFFYNEPRIIFYLAPLLLLSLAYFFPAVKLRKNAWFKLLTLVIVWTTVTAVVPILLGPIELFTGENIFHIFVRFTFMMAICIPFDIRDVDIDKADKVSTVPQLIGIDRTRRMAVAFIFIYLLLIIAEYGLGMFGLRVCIALLLSAFINAMLLFMTNRSRGEYFYVLGLDGTMILQGVFLLLASLKIPL